MRTSVLEYLETSAARRPESIAVIDETGEYSYRQLLDASRRAGNSLTREDVGGHPVMLVAEKGFSMLATMFGVLYAGGYYVPVDPDMYAQF